LLSLPGRGEPVDRGPERPRAENGEHRAAVLGTGAHRARGGAGRGEHLAEDGPFRLVGRARVGQDTNFDRLIMEIWTDGTLKPEAALSRSAQILIAHLRDIAGVTEESLLAAAAREEQPRLASEIYDIPIENLDLSVRVFNSLKRTGITTVGEVLDMLEKGPDAMLSIRNFGEKSLDELRERLIEKGYLASAVPEGEVTGEAEPAAPGVE